MRQILIITLIIVWTCFILLPIAETIYYYRSKKNLSFKYQKQLEAIGITVTIKEEALSTTFIFEGDDIQEKHKMIYEFIWNEIERTTYHFHSTKIEIVDNRHIQHVLIWK